MNKTDRNKPENVLKYIEKSLESKKNVAALINVSKRQKKNLQSIELFEQTEATEDQKSHVRRLGHVYCVSLLEVFLKELIFILKHWYTPGVDELLEKQSYNLVEAFDVFRGQEVVSKEVTKEFLISHFYSFNSFHQIESVFSKLTGTSFFKTIDEYHKETTREPYLDIAKFVIRLYEVRNKIVHECNNDPYSLDQFRETSKNTWRVIGDINNYCVSVDHNKVAELRKQGKPIFSKLKV